MVPTWKKDLDALVTETMAFAASVNEKKLVQPKQVDPLVADRTASEGDAKDEGIQSDAPVTPLYRHALRAAMSNLDLNDWEFADDEEANMTIRAAVHYRLKGVAGGDRGDIVTEIIEIVRRAVLDADQPMTSPADSPPRL